MIVFFITIPLMILGIAIAILPLSWAMKHHEEWEASALPTPLEESRDEEPIAA
jgi:hypothetical protein